MRRSSIRRKLWTRRMRPWRRAARGCWPTMPPGGDVVLFYDSYSANPSLYELGQVVSGGELVGELSGTVVIQPVE